MLTTHEKWLANSRHDGYGSVTSGTGGLDSRLRLYKISVKRE